jgi:hypothetical protein
VPPTPRPRTALKRSPAFGAELVLEAAVDTPLPDVEVEKDVVDGVALVKTNVEVTVSDAETLAEDDVDNPLLGIEVVNEIGGDGVTVGMVTEVITPVLLEVGVADVLVGMPVARELLIRF